jgi:hypothetical protein
MPLSMKVYLANMKPDFLGFLTSVLLEKKREEEKNKKKMTKL